MARFLLAVLLAVGFASAALAQSYAPGAGSIGRPLGGGNLPENLDTLGATITAGTTHTQAGATQCSFTICVVGTASANDGVKLRPCQVPPERTLIINNSGATIDVYPFGASDTINGNTAGADVTQAAMSTTPQTGVVEYVCFLQSSGAASWATH